MSILANRLKSLSDTGRLRAIALIACAGELCVCEIQKVLGMTLSTASRNLRDLEAAGWLKSRREGRWIHYSLNELDAEWETVRRAILDLFCQTPLAQRDLKRRRELEASSDGEICVTESHEITAGSLEIN